MVRDRSRSSDFAAPWRGMLFSPQPAGAVSKEIIELQQQVSQVLQGHRIFAARVDTNSATLKTLVQQSLDSVNQAQQRRWARCKNRAGSSGQYRRAHRHDDPADPGISDNLQDVQARVGKLSQQLTDIQNLLQSIDAKVSGCVRRASPNRQRHRRRPAQDRAELRPPPACASHFRRHSLSKCAAGLHQREIRSVAAGVFRLHQEFPVERPGFQLAVLSRRDFLRAERFQGRHRGLRHRARKLSAELQARGVLAEERHGRTRAWARKRPACAILRDVVRRFPGSDEARRAQAKLRRDRRRAPRAIRALLPRDRQMRARVALAAAELVWPATPAKSPPASCAPSS